jgi:hypothetical protein
MIRCAAIILLLALVGCADQSKGAALNECRMEYYLESPAAQSELTPDCMKAKSFLMASPCIPETDGQDWDWQVMAYPFDNPKCYRPIGSTTWIATLLSPM